MNVHQGFFYEFIVTSLCNGIVNILTVSKYKICIQKNYVKYKAFFVAKKLLGLITSNLRRNIEKVF